MVQLTNTQNDLIQQKIKELVELKLQTKKNGYQELIGFNMLVLYLTKTNLLLV